MLLPAETAYCCISYSSMFIKWLVNFSCHCLVVVEGLLFTTV